MGIISRVDFKLSLPRMSDGHQETQIWKEMRRAV